MLFIVNMRHKSTVDGVMLFVVDEVIGQVIGIMKSQSVPYTAVFTALQPSRVRQSCVHLNIDNLTLQFECQACNIKIRRQ